MGDAADFKAAEEFSINRQLPDFIFAMQCRKFSNDTNLLFYICFKTEVVIKRADITEASPSSRHYFSGVAADIVS